jgi:hypothetical protein
MKNTVWTWPKPDRTWICLAECSLVIFLSLIVSVAYKSRKSKFNRRLFFSYVFCVFFVLLRFAFVLQCGAVFLAICHILVLKSLISVLFIAFWIQNLWLACYLLHLGTKISHFPCYWQHSGLKSQIWVFKIVNLHDNFNILVFTHLCYGFQRCLDGFYRFFDRLQWSFPGFKDLLRFRLKVFERLGFHLGFP